MRILPLTAAAPAVAVLPPRPATISPEGGARSADGDALSLVRALQSLKTADRLPPSGRRETALHDELARGQQLTAVRAIRLHASASAIAYLALQVELVLTDLPPRVSVTA